MHKVCGRFVERLGVPLEDIHDRLDAQSRHLHRIEFRSHRMMHEDADARAVLQPLGVTSQPRHLNDERRVVRSNRIRQKRSDQLRVHEHGRSQDPFSVDQFAKRNESRRIHSEILARLPACPPDTISANRRTGSQPVPAFPATDRVSLPDTM